MYNNSLPSRDAEDVVQEAIRQIQHDLSEQMKKQISKDAGSKAMVVEDVLVEALLDKPKQYTELSASGKRVGRRMGLRAITVSAIE